MTRALQLPLEERTVAVEALFYLVAMRVALRFVPFRTLAARLGRVRGESEALSGPFADGESAEDAGLLSPDLRESPSERMAAEQVGRRIRSSATLLPWTSTCLVRALAAQRMLARRGIGSTLYLGVKDGDGLEAHAWLRVASCYVTGGNERHGFRVIAVFEQGPAAAEILTPRVQ